MTKLKPLRCNFTDKDKDLYEYLETKTSKTAFIKDLIRREMLRDYNYINLNNSIQMDQPIKAVSVDLKSEEYEFDLNDLDL